MSERQPEEDRAIAGLVEDARVGRHRGTKDVPEDGPRQDLELPPGASHPGTPLDIFVVEDKSLVEDAAFPEDVGSREESGPGQRARRKRGRPTRIPGKSLIDETGAAAPELEHEPGVH